MFSLLVFLGFLTNFLLPVNKELRVMRISAGVDMSMAVTTTGEVYGWGAMKGGRLGLGLASNNVSLPRPVFIQSESGKPLKAVDVDCGYVHSLIVAANGTVHLCGGVGTDGDSDGQAEERDNGDETSSTAGRPRQIEDMNIWHRVPEPKEHVKKEKWKKYGKYEVKGRAKMMTGDD